MPPEQHALRGFPSKRRPGSPQSPVDPPPPGKGKFAGLLGPDDPDPLPPEPDVLWRRGLLSKAEAAAQVREWREGFQEAQREPFHLTLRPGEVLHGDEARREHYKDRGIPGELVRKWTAEGKRRARTIE